jgi:hypothetical protein
MWTLHEKPPISESPHSRQLFSSTLSTKNLLLLEKPCQDFLSLEFISVSVPSIVPETAKLDRAGSSRRGVEQDGIVTILEGNSSFNLHSVRKISFL